VSTVAVILALALALPPGQLTILVRQGQDAENDVRTRTGTTPVVEVRDESGHPVAGAAVTFRLPGAGPGGSFHGWMREQTLRTDAEGKVGADGFAPNGEAGRFEIAVMAEAGGKTGYALIPQTNGPPPAAGPGRGRGPWQRGGKALLVMGIAGSAMVVASRVLLLKNNPGSKINWWLTATAAGSVLGTVAAISRHRGRTRRADKVPTATGPVSILPVHHAGILLRNRDGVIYVDPSGASYYAGAPRADLILITDAGSDHFEPALLPRLSGAGTVVYGPESAAAGNHGIMAIRNGEKRVWRHWEIEAVPAYSPARTGQGRVFHEKGLGNGYVLAFGGKRFYVSGNTGNTGELRALEQVDVAFLAMNPPYTMTAAEAADAVRAFRPKTVYPYHYRGSLLAPFEFKKALADSAIEVRIRNWY